MPAVAVCAMTGSYACAGQTGFGENGLVTISIPDYPDVHGADIALDQAGRTLVSGGGRGLLRPFRHR